MIIILFAFAQAQEFRTALGRTIKTQKLTSRRKYPLAGESEWHYIHFENKPDIDILEKNYIPIRPNSVINSNLYRVFCSYENLTFLTKQFNATVGDISMKEKYVSQVPPSNEVTRLLIEVDPSFESKHYAIPYFNLSKLTDTIYLCVANNGEYAVKILSSIPEVITITKAYKSKVSNRYSAGRIQGGGVPQLTDRAFETFRYMEYYSLNGEGQVVAVMDSGIDMNSTYFYDPKVKLVFDDYNPEHRKIVYYGTKYGNFIDENSHGTHVCGTIAGKALCETLDCVDSLYNGVAPEAKIAFIDVGKGTSGEVEKPDSAYINGILDKTGAKILSASLGETVTLESLHYMNLMNRVEDEILFDHPELLYVYAAGNSGESKRSVELSASAKNVLGVGNIQNYYAAVLETPGIPGAFIALDSNNNKSLLMEIPGGKKMADYPDLTINGELRDAGSAYSPNHIVLMDTLDCSPLEGKIYSAAIFPASETEEMPQCFNVNFPLFMGKVENLRGSIIIRPNKISEITTIQETSSTGPTILGLKKPDVSAIGTFVVSAGIDLNATSIHNRRALKAGTSMATPMVSGAAALIRQYFAKGLFTGKNMEPNGCTLKALLAASCDPVSIPRYEPIVTEGHGEVNIRNILNVEKNSDGSKINMGKFMAVGQDIKIHNGMHMVTSVNVKSRGYPLRIAMSYNDHVLASETLHNIGTDVTLFVEPPNGEGIYGNGVEEMQSTLETVIIDGKNVVEGEYKIHLICHSLNTLGNVSASVVVVGDMERDSTLSFVSTDKCLNNCSGKGICDNGFCKCDSHSMGSSCQNHINDLNEGDIQFPFKALEMRTFRYKAKDDVNINIELSTQRTLDDNATCFWYLSRNLPSTLIDNEDIGLFANKESILSEKLTQELKKGKSLYITIYNSNPLPQNIEIAISSKALPNIGLIVGVTIGCVAAVAAICVLVYIFVFRKKSDSTQFPIENKQLPPRETDDLIDNLVA